ncbi:MAG TPA: hypothetical protein VGG16_03680 [Streptosporangiaceae bacterium]|jgi:hypothetical protein
MRGHRRKAAAALAVASLAASCGSTTASPATATRQVTAIPLSPATSLTAPSGATWATIPMGGTGPNLFWQLFTLPAGGSTWTLRTPPAIATNGALILATAGQTLTAGIRPSLYLSFSPVTSTSDGGIQWTTSPPEPGLADVPDALAAAPGGQMIALDQDQHVSEATTATAAWNTMTSRTAVTATPSGRDCDLTALTAVAYTPARIPLLGGTCARPGTTGIFTSTAGTWNLAGPVLPAAFAGARVQVLRLTNTGTGDTALLKAGNDLIAAWSPGDASKWTLSPALPLDGTSPMSASTSASGATAVVLSGGRGEILGGTHDPWRPLPPLPAARAITLAILPDGTAEALAADGATLTIWQLATGPARWFKVQVIKVPIQYGSSS